MGEWDTAYSAYSGTPAPGDDFLIRQLSATPPPGGTLRRLPLSGLRSAVYGTLAQTATVYVATTGSDSTGDGLSWQTAFATIPHAISALPAVGGIQMGTVEVGAGAFTVTSGGSPAISLGNTQCVYVNGRGLAESYTGGAPGAPQYLTVITDTGTGTTVSVTMATNQSQSGGLSNLSLSTTTAANGIVVNNTSGFALNNVTIDGYSVFGFTGNDDIGAPMVNVVATRCGNAGASTPTGGFYFDVGPTYGVQMNDCGSDSCTGFGIYSTGGTVIYMIGGGAQYTTASAMSGSGAGFYVGGTSHGNGPYTFYSAWFESNATYGVDSNQFTIIMQFTGCNFAGDSVQLAGINAAGPTLVDGCNFLNHVSESVNNPNQQPIAWRGCSSTDTVFVNNGGGVYGTIGKLSAQMAGTAFMGSNQSFWPQPLTSNGAVTFYPGLGELQIITLTANATSSTVDTSTFPAATGQVMTICWIQGAGGSHTYAWPANCKFAAGSAPAASTTAGYEDNVTFHWNGTNWIEISRAVGVH